MNSQSLTSRLVLKRFISILTVFILIDLLSWPILFSLNLWILGDRGSFLNLDYLQSQHLRLGVDVYYAYGLLPVLIQHWLFVLFGMGYWPLIGCAVITLILMALFWALYLRHFPEETVWFLALLATCRIILWVNPNFPYSLVQLSMLFALLFVLLGKMDIGLAISALGAWSVPSLSLVLMASLAFCIILNWYFQPNRSALLLIRSLAPGIVTYAAVGVLLVTQFGWQSVLATATPIAGMRFYRVMYYGALNSSIIQFVHPPNQTVSYYLFYTFCTPVAWWVLSVLSLSVFGVLAIRRMLVNKVLTNRDVAITVCAVVHGVFVCFAYGAHVQHYIFDPLLVMGMLLGLTTLPKGKARAAFLSIYVCLAVLGQATFVRATLSAWKQDVRPPDLTANLYASSDWVSEWKQILDLSTHKNLFLLSYSTGVHDYFPTVHSADAWFLNPGELTPADKDRLMRKLESAEVVAFDLSSPTTLVDTDPDVQGYLKSLCLTQSTKYFQVWWRPSQVNGHECIANLQRVPKDSGYLQ
ncbi:MAG: hypothetical protein ABSE51_03990 [Terracidiphilus sp.]|jgi:hypothetical protein